MWLHCIVCLHLLFFFCLSHTKFCFVSSCIAFAAFRHHQSLVVENNREQLPVDDGRREPSEAGRRGGGALIFFAGLVLVLFIF